MRVTITSRGGQGNDSLYGGAGDDVIDEDGAGVKLGAQWGNDYIDAGDGNDIAYAGDGNDTLLGGAGNDVLYGEQGDDTLCGGLGADTLIGGVGADQFLFNAALVSGNADSITDFNKAKGDQIALDRVVFDKLTGLNSLVDHFRLNTQTAVGNDDYVVYKASTGELFYDASGNGSAAGVLIATLTNKPQDMTAQQFVVV